jgi:hypothetical protein
MRTGQHHAGKLHNSVKVSLGLCLAALTGALAACQKSTHAGGTCLSPSTGVSHVRDAIAHLVSSDDTIAARYRADKDLPTVDSTQVSVVRDGATCARASRALARVRTDMDPKYGAWVIRVGDKRFVAFNGVLSGAEHSLLLVVYDTSFTQLSTFPM